jgi:hypothetical protein
MKSASRSRILATHVSYQIKIWDQKNEHEFLLLVVRTRRVGPRVHPGCTGHRLIAFVLSVDARQQGHGGLVCKGASVLEQNDSDRQRDETIQIGMLGNSLLVVS